LPLIAEVVRERRAQRAVGEAGGEDRLLTRPAFATEERSGDLAGGVHAFFDVDGQREEVDPLTRLRRRDCREQRGATDLHDDRAGGELRELACLERHLEAGGVYGTGNANRVVTHDERFLSFMRREASVPSCQRPTFVAGRSRLTTDVVLDAA